VNPAPTTRPITPETWFLVNSGPGDASFNMAFDLALLESAPDRGRPVLRFYGWTQPAASFGYFQRLQDVERLTQLRPLVRRPTGGGLVPHDADWTYTLCFPPTHPWYALRATQSYERVHSWICSAFRRLNVDTSLAPATRREAPGQCFVGAERNDLLWHGRKIAGAAQRRNRAGLLIQGSIQPPPVPLVKIDWQQAMCDVASQQWAVSWEPLPHDGSLLDRTVAHTHRPIRGHDSLSTSRS
jgi:lipoyl(octanoyl) transferase